MQGKAALSLTMREESSLWSQRKTNRIRSAGHVDDQVRCEAGGAERMSGAG